MSSSSSIYFTILLPIIILMVTREREQGEWDNLFHIRIYIITIIFITYCYIIREREQGEWDNPFQPEGEVSQDAEVSQTIRIS